MTAQELNTYIDKVLGNSIRCLLPSYWWKRLLTQIVGYVESVDAKTEGNTGRVYSLERYIKSKIWIAITTKDTGSSTVKADRDNIEIASNSTKKVHFFECFKVVNSGENIDSIDTSMAYTSNVTDMDSMFYNCKSLTSLDVSSFDTSNVTDMGCMFDHCSSLTSLDVSSFDTSKVTDMSFMFKSCDSLTSLDVSGFDTSNVVDMSYMFNGCMSLTSLDVSGFDTSKVTDMSRMFMRCYELASLDLSGFDTSNVLSMYEMFNRCSNITILSLGEGFFKTKSVTEVDFSDLGNWAQDSFLQSVVTNSYDRTSNGLPNITIKLHANTYAYLTDEHKATLTSKGYDVVSV